MGLHAVADDLQSLLVEVIDLALTSKQASWTLGRSLFSPVRTELDELAADARRWADELGERLAGMGVPPTAVRKRLLSRPGSRDSPPGSSTTQRLWL